MALVREAFEPVPVLTASPFEQSGGSWGRLRELLLALRALIHRCVQRAEHRSAPPAEVQDIPIL
jgi:hypothetical protein